MARLPSDLQVHTDFRAFFRPANNGTSEDQYVYQHKNGLCVVGVAAHHPLLGASSSGGRTVTQVDYNVGRDRDRNKLQVSGKKKAGAVLVRPDTELCRVSCSDGTSYMLRMCVGGRLIEINKRLLSDPQLLQRSPTREGYLGLVIPSTEHDQGNDSKTRPPPDYSLIDSAAYDPPDI